MTNTHPYCAQASRDLCEPMLGTAPQVDAWLLLEFNGLWERKAVQDNALLPEVQRWFAGAVQALSDSYTNVRPQLIKQRRAMVDSVTVMICAQGRLLRKAFPSYEALVQWRLAEHDMTEVQEPHYFVCTNGRRDRCCSKFGLPCYRRLRELVGERVWETTHTGGHRFAPNVVTLPQGALYGRVFSEEAEAFVAAIEQGQLSVPHLRGRSAYPPEAQVAEVGVEGILQFLGVNNGEVSFLTVEGETSVRVTRAPEPIEVIASCGNAAEPVFPFL